MKTEFEIEDLLRRAPKPEPMPQLARSLKSKVALSASANGADLYLEVPFWRRWFPAFAYGVMILGCFVVLAVQTTERRELIRENQKLRDEITVAADESRQRQAEVAKDRSSAREIEQWRRDAAEADRLAERLAQLQSQIAALTAQSQELESQLAVNPATQPILAPYDFFGGADSSLNKAREKAASISCINNLKQIGLAYRIYANDNDGWFPPTFNSMSNELSVARTLCCPEDKASLELAKSLFDAAGPPSQDQDYYGRLNAAWARWPVNGGSYEMLTAGVQQNSVPIDRLLARCRIHGHYVQADGSAHMVAKPGGDR